MKAVQTKQPVAITACKLATLFTEACTNKQGSPTSETVQLQGHRQVGAWGC